MHSLTTPKTPKIDKIHAVISNYQNAEQEPRSKLALQIIFDDSKQNALEDPAIKYMHLKEWIEETASPNDASPPEVNEILQELAALEKVILARGGKDLSKVSDRELMKQMVNRELHAMKWVEDNVATDTDADRRTIVNDLIDREYEAEQEKALKNKSYTAITDRNILRRNVFESIPSHEVTFEDSIIAVDIALSLQAAFAGQVAAKNTYIVEDNHFFVLKGVEDNDLPGPAIVKKMLGELGKDFDPDFSADNITVTDKREERATVEEDNIKNDSKDQMTLGKNITLRVDAAENPQMPYQPYDENFVIEGARAHAGLIGAPESKAVVPTSSEPQSENGFENQLIRYSGKVETNHNTQLVSQQVRKGEGHLSAAEQSSNPNKGVVLSNPSDPASEDLAVELYTEPHGPNDQLIRPDCKGLIPCADSKDLLPSKQIHTGAENILVVSDSNKALIPTPSR